MNQLATKKKKKISICFFSKFTVRLNCHFPIDFVNQTKSIKFQSILIDLTLFVFTFTSIEIQIVTCSNFRPEHFESKSPTTTKAIESIVVIID